MGGRLVVLVAFALVAFGVLVAGCAATRPSDAQIRDLVAAEAGAAGEDPLFDLRDFRRVDGRDAGEGRYVADVAYTLVYRKSSKEVKDALASGMKDAGRPEGLGRVGEALGRGLGMVALAFQSFERGDTKDVAAQVTLERWESGWRLATTP